MPFFGDMGLSEITPGKAEEYRVHRLSMSKTGKAPARSTIPDEIVTLRKCLRPPFGTNARALSDALCARRHSLPLSSDCALSELAPTRSERQTAALPPEFRGPAFHEFSLAVFVGFVAVCLRC